MLDLLFMKNPIKFIQEVKQEAFKVTWPTGKETLQGALMVFLMALVMSLFLAGAEGIEPPTYGFGDGRSTN